MTTNTLGAWPSVWGVPEESAPKYIALLRRQLMQAFAMEEPPSLRHAYETGMACLRATGVDLTPLPEEAREAFHQCSQHRLELLQTEGELPGFVAYDGRAMYLGVAGLPIGAGPVQHVGPVTLAPDDRGRVCVRFRVPDDWQGVGLLAVPPGDGTRWVYPCRPGYETETWADCCEARLAQKCGWFVEVREGWILQRAAPLAAWANRLETLYDRARHVGDTQLARLYRDITIITIGWLHSRGLKDEITPVRRGHEELIAPGEEWSVTADGYAIHDRVARNKPADSFHPEWSAAVYSYTHYRVARALLTVPKASVVAVRGDAVYLTGDPQWADSGNAGCLRYQGMLPGPVPAPKNFDELAELSRRAREHG